MNKLPPDNRSMARSAAVVGGATVLSRIMGLVRDIVLAGVLGTSVSADAFFAAFRIPNVLRRMFAEGSLAAAFIPVFTEIQSREGRQAALDLGYVVLSWLLLLLFCLSAAGILFAPQVVHLLTPGWIDDPGKFSLTVSLTRIMFPYILLVSLMALAMGILNAQGHFATPALAPVLLNLAMIASAVWASRALAEPAFGVAVGVIIGGIVQVLFQIPSLWKRGFRYRWNLPLHHPELKRVRRLFLPSVFGSAVYQVNMVIITILASLLPHGSLSYLYYADRLFQFPLGVFAIAFGTAALPLMSRHAAEKDLGALQRTLSYAFRQVSLIMIPSTVALIVLREPLISLLFQRGRFDHLATTMSALALMYYGLGLWFVAEIRVVTPAFYALKDTLTPMKVASLAVAFNLFFCIVLMRPLGHCGLALALSLSSIFQFGILVWKLRPRLRGPQWLELFGPLPRTILASIGMGIICWLITRGVDWLGPAPFYEKAAILGVSIGLGMVAYGTFLYFLKVRELHALANTFMSLIRGEGS
jgi:putative peptidoglycan lipid II flippase